MPHSILKSVDRFVLGVLCCSWLGPQTVAQDASPPAVLEHRQSASEAVLQNIVKVENESAAPQQTPTFSRDIQPILSRACTSCHGGVKQAAELSFVDSRSVLPPTGYVIQPGRPDDSELFMRISSQDPELRMPPANHAALSAEEIETIRIWIDQGAQWQEHWSRTPLLEPQVPCSDDSLAWAKQPLDHFVAQGHLARGLVHSVEAEPRQWLRRVSFDLTGLPPQAEDIDRFLSCLDKASRTEDRDELYALEVDRLLASSSFGERWAALWMDLARYADSKGYEKDPHRDVWPYRDWLINAFNADMPYDEFSIKQLAGDLLPDAGYQDLVATAFHRNTQTNTEGGTDDEQYRVEATIDRLNTTWIVWQATTFGCTQCHSHPYEPLAHREFYAGLALFNNVEDCDLDSEFPTLPYLENVDEQEEWFALDQARQHAQERLDEMGRRLVQQTPWDALPIQSLVSSSGEIEIENGEVRIKSGTISVGTTYTVNSPASSVAAIRLRILPEADDPASWPEQGSVLSSVRFRAIGLAEASDALHRVESPEQTQPLSDVDSSTSKSREIKASAVVPDYRAGPFQAEEVLNSEAGGFGGYPKLFGPRWVVLILQEPVALGEGELLQIELAQKASVTGGLSNHLRRFRIEFSADRELSELTSSEIYQSLQREVGELNARLAEFKGIKLPVVRQRQPAATRETREFVRGNFLEKGSPVAADIPSVFRLHRSEIPRIDDRLAFAKWLVSDENPLAARVWVNRIWAALFGLGIVETLEDFGVSGQRPTNQPLLDHLAFTLQHHENWSLKAILRKIVLSATYRQDSRTHEAQRKRDPNNQYLARGPRNRLSAEMVRDQALAASGLLCRKVGGPSVMPPQPGGVWQQAYSSAEWKAAEGEDRFRRGLYTYWRRTSPYPGFIMFDAPTRDVCSPRRITTNTPLQALVTLNSEVYTQLAQTLADQSEARFRDPRAAIRDIYVRLTSREPSTDDLSDLMELFRALPARPDTQNTLRSAAVTQASEQVESRENPEQGQSLTSLAIVALAILNSDWALTK